MRIVRLAVLLAPASALAAPAVIDKDAIGPRWAGVNYHDNFGWNLVGADVDDDGLGDFVAASPQDEGPMTFDSVVRVYLGTEGGPPRQRLADWASGEFTDGTVPGDAVFSFAVIPDATGDGVPDLLVAEPVAGDYGKVLLYGGDDWSGGANASTAEARWDGYQQDEFAVLAPETRPSSVGAGDIDGDGLADIVIASDLFNRFWVDYSSDGLAPLSGVSLESLPFWTGCTADFPAASFGASIAVADFDDDGFADVATGGAGCNGGAGQLFVWYGGAGGLPASADLVVDGVDRLGGTVTALDLDADGISDLAVQELLSGGAENRGGLWLFFGGAAGLPSTPDTVIAAGFSDGRFGATVAALPDVSNPADGLPELIVGSPEASYTKQGQGAVYVFDSTGGWPGQLEANDARYRIGGTGLDSRFGQSVAAVPDFDGDGYPEFVIGEPNYSAENSENEFHRGRVFLANALPDRDEDGDGISTLTGDCDDRDAAVRPGLVEQCNGFDDDCDHEIDEGCGDDDDSTPEGDDDDSALPGDDDDCTCSTGIAESDRSGLASLVVVLLALRRQRRRTL